MVSGGYPVSRFCFYSGSSLQTSLLQFFVRVRVIIRIKQNIIMSYLVLAIFVTATMLCGVSTVWSVSVEEDLSLTRDQRKVLDRFRNDIIQTLPESYMKEDIYLVRWLRAKNFNIEQAKTMLRENLQWRLQNNMSRIHEEDWSDMQEDYPYFIDTFDKTGRPMATLRFGEWNIKRAVLTSKSARLTRYLYKALDEVTGKIRNLQKEGKEVTQWVSLLDMDGYSFINHGCIQCLRVYIAYVTAYESYFPGSVHEILLINTPAIFEAVLTVTRPLLSESTGKVLHVFGTNKQRWTEYLRQRIAPEQLEQHFGGTKIRQEF